MAKNTVPQGAQTATKALTEIDEIVQDATESISALAAAAKKMLALDARSLMTVSELLSQIHAKAEEIQNDVNCKAEEYGAHYQDDSRSELRQKLWTQHHALRGTGDAPRPTV